MYQHQLDTMIHHLDRQEREHRPYRPVHRWWQKAGRRVGAPIAIVLLCGLTLSGCTSGNGSAEAQVLEPPGQEKQIETLVIDPASFFLQTDAAPTVEVKDNATTYFIPADARLTFATLEDSALTIDLEVNDIVIERPGSGTITVIRDK